MLCDDQVRITLLEDLACRCLGGTCKHAKLNKTGWEQGLPAWSPLSREEHPYEHMRHEPVSEHTHTPPAPSLTYTPDHPPDYCLKTHMIVFTSPMVMPLNRAFSAAIHVSAASLTCWTAQQGGRAPGMRRMCFPRRMCFLLGWRGRSFQGAQAPAEMMASFWNCYSRTPKVEAWALYRNGN